MRRSAAVVVRPVVVVDGQKTPAVPPTWRVVPECDGWTTLYPNPERVDLFVHAWLACETTAGAFVIFGPRALVDAIVAAASRSWTSLAALRADNGAVATAVKTAWLARWGGAVLPFRVAGYDEDDGEETGP